MALKYEYHKDGTEPPVEVHPDGSPIWIFVFGSNLAGRHGAGAALCALHHYGARLGVGIGREGKSYGIPTKDEKLRTLSLAEGPRNIHGYVNLFKAHAKHRQLAEEKFWVTAIGTQLAGYKHDQIAPLFVGSPHNCSFPEEWMEYLEEPKDIINHFAAKREAELQSAEAEPPTASA